LENTADNPYKTPDAEVVINNGNNNLNAVYDRFSAWGVLGLSIITFGIYVVYWLYNRTKKINARVDNPISSGFITAALVLYVLSFVLPFIGGFTGSDENIYSLISIPAGIVQIVWYYKLRNRIHSYVNAQKGTYAWIGPIKTFFFNVLYLQYKINKIIDNE
jgi:cytochrome b561